MPEFGSIRDTHREGFAALDAVWARLDLLEGAMHELSDTAPGVVEDPIARVLDKIAAFEPAVSVIGQIKAGKSTLVNALVGAPGLLPSDVNPWTSVITAIHLNSRHRPLDTRALFRFFDRREWDRLMETGGRLGEMSARAGFTREAEEVRAQVAQMRQITETRLGQDFDRLLGGSHAFAKIEKSVIDRYICYGDPDDLAAGASDGAYADITKSADLYLDLPDMPRGLCLRDTPGVNDTFMMREQITLNAIGDSRVCVVVLSAHQALSTMDVALLRIIGSVEEREVVIFVNRIDELADPEAQKQEIRTALRRRLDRLGFGDAIEILFGSGHWAVSALGEIDRMVPASRAALARLFPDADLCRPDTARACALEASGIGALHRAIARRVVEGPARAFLKDIEGEIETILEMSETIETVAGRQRKGLTDLRIGVEALAQKLESIRTRALAGFDSRAEDLRAQLRERLERAQASFTDTALEALRAHLDTFGEDTAWSHDPSGLRMMMKTAFNASTARLRREGETAFEQVFDDIQQVLETDLGVWREGGGIEFPEQPQHAAPTVLARTLCLDLQGPWWRKFWRLGRRRAAEARYRDAILAETTPLIDDLLTQVFDPAIQRTRAVVDRFAREQGRFCIAVHERASASAGAGAGAGMRDLPDRRLSA